MSDFLRSNIVLELTRVEGFLSFTDGRGPSLSALVISLALVSAANSSGVIAGNGEREAEERITLRDQRLKKEFELEREDKQRLTPQSHIRRDPV